MTKLKFSIEATPQQLAYAFWEMDAEEQQEFFATLAGFDKLEDQMKNVVMFKATVEALEAMRIIGKAAEAA